MITWICDKASGVYIGPLNESESNSVAKVLRRHGNLFTETGVFLYVPGILTCSYAEFIEQAKENK